MKSIILSVSPKEALNVLNGKATMLLRKRIPKDFKGWCNLYVGKGKPYLYKGAYKPMHSLDKTDPLNYYWNLNNKLFNIDLQNGKVIARFWWDEYMEFDLEKRFESGGWDGEYYHPIDTDIFNKLHIDIENYVKYSESTDKSLYAIHIKNIEIFDRPKRLNEFKRYESPNDLKRCHEDDSDCLNCKYLSDDLWHCKLLYPVKAPRNYIFVEEE